MEEVGVAFNTPATHLYVEEPVTGAELSVKVTVSPLARLVTEVEAEQLAPEAVQDLLEGTAQGLAVQEST